MTRRSVSPASRSRSTGNTVPLLLRRALPPRQEEHLFFASLVGEPIEVEIRPAQQRTPLRCQLEANGKGLEIAG